MAHRPDRRRFTAAGTSLLVGAGAWSRAAAQGSEAAVGSNVLRVLQEGPETGFDPTQAGDLYSNRIIAHIFEGLVGYDPLALPVRRVPCTAEAMPEASADFKTWTVRLRRGTFFADDPAFKGQPRELVADDYVFAFKRVHDPAAKSPFYSSLNEDGILGLDALRQRALSEKKPFDYRAEVEGLRAAAEDDEGALCTAT